MFIFNNVSNVYRKLNNTTGECIKYSNTYAISRIGFALKDKILFAFIFVKRVLSTHNLFIKNVNVESETAPRTKFI